MAFPSSPCKGSKNLALKDWTPLVIGALSARDLLALCSVNREWFAATRQALLHLRSLSYTGQAGGAWLPPPSKCKSLVNLDASCFRVQCNTHNDWLTTLAGDRAACARLQTLRLGPLVPVAARASLLRYSSSLTSLSLRGCLSIDDRALGLIQAGSLQSLDLSGCWRVTDAGVALVAAHCPRVKRADFRGLIRLTEGALSTASGQWAALATLAMTTTSRAFSADAVADIIAGSHIESLCLNELSLDAAGWSLVLSSVAGRCRRDHLPTAAAQGRSGGATLKRLVVDGAVGLSDTVLESFARSMLCALDGTNSDHLRVEDGTSGFSDFPAGHTPMKMAVCVVRHNTSFVAGLAPDAATAENSTDAACTRGSLDMIGSAGSIPMVAPLLVSIMGCGQNASDQSSVPRTFTVLRNFQ
jgi:hypothetical protein